MKAFKIGLGAIVLLALVFQGWVMYVSKVEEQPYTVLHTFGEVEIRHYPKARMATVQRSSGSSRQTDNNNFRVLAGYIFGGNAQQQEIAMTAPVHMHQSDSMSQMSFVLPSTLWNAELPVPNDSTVQLHWVAEDYVAAIRFGGFRTDRVENAYRRKLAVALDSLQIKHNGAFKLLGYDPPFKVVDRRNEVIVSIDRSTLPH